jgi:hypothetical protein
VRLVEHLRRLGLDVVFDLNGHTKVLGIGTTNNQLDTDWIAVQGARIDLLAFRIAPVQILYKGYAGTSGASFIEYVPFALVPAASVVVFAERSSGFERCDCITAFRSASLHGAFAAG